MADAEGMELEDYVERTLVAVVGGVLKAQAHKDVGDYIGRAPLAGHAQHLKVALDGNHNAVSIVQFDLATTVEAKSSAGGGLGIKVIPWLSLDASAKGENSTQGVSRLQFVVPISVPQPDAQRQSDRREMQISQRAIDSL